MELIEAITDQISDNEVRRRHLESSVGEHTMHYVACESGVDIGLLSVDPIPGYDDFIIYEIFVPARLRREGIGSRILRAAEKIGKELGTKAFCFQQKL
jgi:GNAT superfamily N-acetyltransferase